MHSQFMSAVRQLCSEKHLPEEMIMDIVKAAIKTAYRKDYGNKDQNIEVEIDPKTELSTVYLVREVVDIVENETTQISLKDAKILQKDIAVGGVIRMDVTPSSYGRIAAQAAKQVIMQRIQEAERDFLYNTFKDRENELINALIHRVDEGNVYVELGGTTALLSRREQIPNENYFGGQRIKLYLDKVTKTSKGPQLVISRTHPGLVEKMLTLEIPEIKSGVVRIMGVAREPGMRCKVAVHSQDPQVDPIGACVGQGGVRIQGITQELSGERIDVIPFSENPALYIQEALKPAKIAKVQIFEDKKLAKVYVTEDQRALAIGKSGQNVRLASKLTHWEIDVEDADSSMASAEVTKPKKEAIPDGDALEFVSQLDLSPEVIEKLEAASLEKVAQLKGLTVKDFAMVDGITEEEAAQIVEQIKKQHA